MALSHLKFKELLDRAQKAGPTPYTFDSEDRDQDVLEQLPRQLQYALINFCEGAASRLVQRQDIIENEAESWILLYNI